MQQYLDYRIYITTIYLLLALDIQNEHKYTVFQKIRLAQSWISPTTVSLLQWNLSRDILLALAIKRVHNLPPYLSYVYTLPDITQKPKCDTDELKQRLIDNWDCIHQGIIGKAIDQCTYVKTKGRHFEQATVI